MKKVNEANMNISVNGDSAAEVSELLRIMQLAGTGAKEVGADDINQKMLPSPMDSDEPCDICGGDHGPSDLMAGCGAKSSSETMGDTIRMISAGEEAYEEEEDDGGFGDATTEPDELSGDVSDMIPAGDDLHKEKGSYPATAGGDNPMNTESIHTMLTKALAEKKAKPDFLDVDKDGDTKEPMKKAAKDAGKGSKPKKGQVPPQFKKKTNEGFTSEAEAEASDPKAIIRQRTIELARKANVSMKKVNLDKVYKYIEQRKSLGKGPVNQQPEKIEKLIEYYQNMAFKSNPDYNDRVMDLIYDKVVEMVDEVAPMIHNTSAVDSNEAEEVAERDIESNFENKHKDINNLGRKMIDMSTKMSGTDDTSLMMSNALSRLGEVLAEFGGTGFAANNMNDVIKKSALSKEIVQMLMKKAKAAE